MPQKLSYLTLCPIETYYKVHPDGRKEEITETVTSINTGLQGTSERRTAKTERKTMHSTSGGATNVFSRLTQPTKTHIMKSRRAEDRRTKDEWRSSMNKQIEYEESLMNEGGFVLKEQRYKKVGDSFTPGSANRKAKQTTSVTKFTSSGGRNQFSVSGARSFSGNNFRIFSKLDTLYV